MAQGTQGTKIVTRFAPSPTGYLHIGGARTALFNFLYARHHGGVFRLRIEDTDRKRSTPEAIEAIIDGLSWLGLAWDDEIVHQFARMQRHAEVAKKLLAAGKAYHCYCTPEELDAMRQQARAEGRAKLYDGRWRDRDPAQAPAGVDPVIRLKAPLDGETVIEDLVQGRVEVANAQLDDMVLQRADGTPTYMLSVVVDDHDMGVTHVIRGDDHLTNAFRQTQLFLAMGWDLPRFAHIPLIHGPDGAKLSKRHGALGIEAYRDMGYLPETLRNYLLRLGWSHGDEEIISDAQAREWFDLDAVGRSPARLDFAKLDNLNGHYIREADDKRLVDLLIPFLSEAGAPELDDTRRARLLRGMAGLKPRAKTLKDLAQQAAGYIAPRPLSLSAKADNLLSPESRARLGRLLPLLQGVTWDEASLDRAVRDFAESEGVKLGQIAQPLRAALTGSDVSPGIFEVMIALGQDEALGRISDQIPRP
jgi:glutamyl-tRNA synthetase